MNQPAVIQEESQGETNVIWIENNTGTSRGNALPILIKSRTIGESGYFFFVERTFQRYF